jgi:glycosyltransferase involved in cell wall biosynthesis
VSDTPPRLAIGEHVECLVVPSLCPEAFGRVVQAAAEAGIPVLARNIGALPEAAAVPGALTTLFEPTRRNSNARCRRAAFASFLELALRVDHHQHSGTCRRECSGDQEASP